MGREKTLRIAGLNIVSHPHSPELYIKLLSSAKTQNVASNYFGNRWGRIGSFYEKNGAYCGHFHLFTDFDQNKPWLDLLSGKQAEQSTVDSIINSTRNYQELGKHLCNL